MKKRIVASLMFGALALAPAVVRADDRAPSLEELVVQMADTPAQHAALASYFRGKADEARNQARIHESMGRSMGAGKAAQQQQMKSHCQALSARYTAVAEEYEALAKIQDQEAGKSK